MLPNRRGLEIPIGVVTGIEGGLQKRKREDTEDDGFISASEEEAGGCDKKSIMTTVRIEQSYV